ncbi:MAG: DUF1015 domain-containing protein [Rhodospirillaceae bacterium]|nr:DUF1015 domain-containing protein [Rhodospirillaceae bacterium]
MSTLVRPFRGLRPTPEAAPNVAAPPYDVLNSAEAKIKAAGKPHSFLHISKPEIDLPDGTDVYAPAVYQKGADNFQAMIKSGVLIRDDAPSYYVYRMRMGAHTQTGLAFVASVADYDTNRIRKHEFTRPDKEDDRVRQIEALNAETGPVLLAYRKHMVLQNILMESARSEPLYEVKGEHGVVHSVWRIAEPEKIARITEAFDGMDALYIADGHHRSAAASRVAAARRGKSKSDSAEYFLAVAFPHDQMRIFDYNRVIKDLNGLTPDELLKKIRTKFIVAEHDQQYAPLSPTHFGMYLGRKWYELVIQPDLVPRKDPVGLLDVSLLQNNLISPILGIADPRRDKRIDFVGGIRGLSELEARVNSGEMAVAFALHATRMDQLMAVADAGEVMPPKSTWFEPKLADGLLSHVLD